MSQLHVRRWENVIIIRLVPMEEDKITYFFNKKWVLKKRPQGLFNAKTCALEEASVCAGDLKENEILVKTEYLSVDAFIRTMLDETKNAVHKGIDVGGTVPAIGIGQVVAKGPKSTHNIGSYVSGFFGAQTYAIADSNQAFGVLPLPGVSRREGLGLFGITTGITAYVGTFCVAKPPAKGEVAVVSAAAGAVGSIAAQLLLSTGATVIGIAGGEKKCKYLTEELKLHGAIDYKSKESVAEQLKKLAPNGVDFFYDNVGGSILDDILNVIRLNGRIIICGAVSLYSGNLNVGSVQGPSNYLKLAENGAEMKGFVVMQYMARY